MNPITRLISTALIGTGAAIVSCNSFAAAPAPAAAEFYPLVGSWHGQGELAEGGQAPLKLKLKLKCQKVSSGWAISCSMHAKGKEVNMVESDLMGVDPVTGQAHWYAVTNQGETHDHLAAWTDAHTMKAHYDWTQDGKHMHEDISFQLNGKRAMSFKSLVSADGQQAGAFTGSLKR